MIASQARPGHKYHSKLDSCSSWDLLIQSEGGGTLEGTHPTPPFFRESDFSQSIECACDWILTAIAMGRLRGGRVGSVGV